MNEIKEKIKELQNQKQEINNLIGLLIKPYVPYNVKNVSPSLVYLWYPICTFWECEKSPIGCCIYNHNEDLAHDHCLFCGQPQERK